MPIPNEEIGQFKPGQSGNPNGRPPGRSITTVLRELMEKQTSKVVAESKTIKEFLGKLDVTNAEAVAATLLYKALVKNDMKAITEILDRTEGRSLQPYSTKVEESSALQINVNIGYKAFPEDAKPND